MQISINRFYICLRFIIPISLFIFLSSCQKFVDVGRPQDKLLTSEIFSSDETAISGMYGIYSYLGRNQSASGMLVMAHPFGGMSADEIVRGTSWELDDQFQENSLQSSNGRVRFIWENAYKIIYYTNSMLEGLEDAPAITDNTRKQLVGECLFLRSLFYFYLVNFYGDVPLITGTDYTVNLNMARTPQAQVYAKMDADLQLASTLLNHDYPVSQRIRPNRFAAVALLARVKLYMKDFAAAEALATEVISDARYGLEEDLDDVFSVNSREAIWQVYPTDNSDNETYIAPYFIPYNNSIPDYHLSQHLLNALEPNDQRGVKWIDKMTIQGTEYFYTYKYKLKSKASSEPYTQYFTPLRLAELYLIRAEARAMQNKIDAAMEDVNAIRQRAGLPALDNITTLEGAMEAILQERRIELMVEFGHRWFDLKRTGLADQVLGAIKGSLWQPTDALYPIHDQDLATAPNLIQNPGYN